MWYDEWVSFARLHHIVAYSEQHVESIENLWFCVLCLARVPSTEVNIDLSSTEWVHCLYVLERGRNIMLASFFISSTLQNANIFCECAWIGLDLLLQRSLLALNIQNAKSSCALFSVAAFTQVLQHLPTSFYKLFCRQWITVDLPS